jgi:hypothetical protein
MFDKRFVSNIRRHQTASQGNRALIWCGGQFNCSIINNIIDLLSCLARLSSCRHLADHAYLLVTQHTNTVDCCISCSIAVIRIPSKICYFVKFEALFFLFHSQFNESIGCPACVSQDQKNRKN